MPSEQNAVLENQSAGVIDVVEDCLLDAEGVEIAYSKEYPHRTQPGVPADDLPLCAEIKRYLTQKYPEGLFTHQHDAITKVFGGANVVITTPTSSGKSLIFTIPAFRGDIRDGPYFSLFCSFSFCRTWGGWVWVSVGGPGARDAVVGPAGFRAWPRNCRCRAGGHDWLPVAAMRPAGHHPVAPASAAISLDSGPASTRPDPASRRGPPRRSEPRHCSTATARPFGTAGHARGCAPRRPAHVTRAPDPAGRRRTDSATDVRCGRAGGSRTARTTGSPASMPRPASPPAVA